jgi:hypothetical protein
MKTLFSLTFLLSFSFLVGCDNSTSFNDGSAPPIPVNGVAWEGGVRYGKMRFVGIDQYGQPQRNADGEYVGQIHRTNENGVLLNAEINGDYTGPLLVVLTKDSYTLEEDGQTVDYETQIRCPLPNGCENDAGDSVAFDDWYVPADGFELLAIFHEVPNPLTVHVTPITHLAAQLAFADFVDAPGLCDNSACNGLITPETIYEANSRVQKQMQLETGFASGIAPWGSEDISDTLVQQDAAKHSLLSMAVFKQMQDRSGSYSDVMQWWLDSYLTNDGQLIEIDQAGAGQLDFKTLFDDAIAIEGEFDGASLSDEHLKAAATVFTNRLSALSADAVTMFSGDLLPVSADGELLSDQVQAARDMVAAVSSWLTGFEVQNYTAFFNEEIHNDITEMETKWGIYNDKLSPVQQTLFQPLLQLVEYGVTCLRGANECDSAHPMHAAATYDSSAKTVSYSFGDIQLQGKFDSEYSQSDLTQSFIYSGTNVVETTEGLVTLSASESSDAKVVLTLQSSLVAGAIPDIRKIVLEAPSIKAQGKNLDGSLMTDVQYLVEDLNVIMRGTLDPVATEGFTNNQVAQAVHFNIESAQFTGNLIEGSGAAQEKIVTQVNLNSSNALVYYSPNRFPDLAFDIDISVFKQMASFGGLDTSASSFGGWLQDPANVDSSVGETLLGKVSYSESNYTDIETELQDILALDNVVSSSYGALTYPGGITALIIWKNNANDDEEYARQCLKVSGSWGCFTEVPLSNLGCGNEYGFKISNPTTGMKDAYSYLQTEGCIAQVNIDGRGIYDIAYPVSGAFTTNEGPFDITLNTAHTLGLSSFNIRSVGFFKQASTTETSGFEDAPKVLFDVTGAMTDSETITLGVSLTHGYQGFSQTEGLSFFNFIPYGERSLWLAVGTDAEETDALVYYILQDNITMTMTAFDYDDSTLANSVNNNPDHYAPLGYIRHAGKLLGTLRKEGSMFVIRYIDGTWQIL